MPNSISNFESEYSMFLEDMQAETIGTSENPSCFELIASMGALKDKKVQSVLNTTITWDELASILGNSLYSHRYQDGQRISQKVDIQFAVTNYRVRQYKENKYVYLDCETRNA